jgi:hypothetical protein
MVYILRTSFMIESVFFSSRFSLKGTVHTVNLAFTNCQMVQQRYRYDTSIFFFINKIKLILRISVNLLLLFARRPCISCLADNIFFYKHWLTFFVCRCGRISMDFWWKWYIHNTGMKMFFSVTGTFSSMPLFLPLSYSVARSAILGCFVSIPSCLF